MVMRDNGCALAPSSGYGLHHSSVGGKRDLGVVPRCPSPNHSPRLAHIHFPPLPPSNLSHLCPRVVRGDGWFFGPRVACSPVRWVYIIQIPRVRNHSAVQKLGTPEWLFFFEINLTYRSPPLSSPPQNIVKKTDTKALSFSKLHRRVVGRVYRGSPHRRGLTADPVRA